jgi:hypothetical protein
LAILPIFFTKEVYMLRKTVLALLVGGTLLAGLSSAYAQDDDSKKKKGKPPAELRQ